MMTTDVEAMRIAKAPAARGAVAAREARGAEAAPLRPGWPGSIPGARYLYDEDGRVLAEAIMGPEGG